MAVLDLNQLAAIQSSIKSTHPNAMIAHVERVREVTSRHSSRVPDPKAHRYHHLRALLSSFADEQWHAANAALQLPLLGQTNRNRDRTSTSQTHENRPRLSQKRQTNPTLFLEAV
jgi:hypothetical protein